MRMYEAIARPVTLCETIQAKHYTRVNPIEMEYGVTKLDRVRNQFTKADLRQGPVVHVTENYQPN